MRNGSGRTILETIHIVSPIVLEEPGSVTDLDNPRLVGFHPRPDFTNTFYVTFQKHLIGLSFLALSTRVWWCPAAPTFLAKARLLLLLSQLWFGSFNGFICICFVPLSLLCYLESLTTTASSPLRLSLGIPISTRTSSSSPTRSGFVLPL